MKILKKCFVFLFVFLLCVSQANAFDKYFEDEKLSISVEMEKNKDALYLLLSFDLKDGWHILYQNPGDVGTPTKFKFSRAKAEIVEMSTPVKFVYDDILTQYGFENQVYYLFKMKGVKSAPRVDVSWTACKDSCEPGKASFELVRQTTPGYESAYLEAKQTFAPAFDRTLIARKKNQKLILAADGGLPKDTHHFIAAEKGLFEASNPQTFSNGELTIETGVLRKMPTSGFLMTDHGTFKVTLEEQKPYLPLLLLIAFVSGILLNLMPCVFPVLSLKAMYLAQNAHKKKGRVVRALLYMAGVVSSFLTIAGLLYIFKKGGALLGWGFQLQSPVFVFVMIVVFVFILLYLFNILKMKTDYAGKLLKVSEFNSFLTGFFAVLIASPCTGPFMGALMGYALFESAEIYFPVFAVLGFGYALPFALLELYPTIVKGILPKPGKWMVCLKYILSIPIILTVFWLCWIFYHQVSINKEADVWMPYSEAKVAQAVERGDAVFIDFTAKWCLSCLLNEKTTLNQEAFLQAAANNHVQLFKADWTNKSDDIFHALKLYKRSSVPLYIFYPKDDSNYEILPQILTPEIALSFIDRE